MWQSCPPSKDEILSSLRTQYDKLRKLNNELEEAQLMQESRNKEIIKSLKQQRTYLGRFNFFTLIQENTTKYLHINSFSSKDR